MGSLASSVKPRLSSEQNLQSRGSALVRRWRMRYPPTDNLNICQQESLGAAKDKRGRVAASPNPPPPQHCHND
jgi:hypothetical protein